VRPGQPGDGEHGWRSESCEAGLKMFEENL
jgi:hypothetical protein